MNAIPEEAALGFELVAERRLVAADGLLETPYRTHITWCRRLEV